MKRLWLAGGLLAAVVALCAGTLYFQHRQVTGLLGALDAVEAAYATDDPARAHTLAAQLCSRYDRDTALFPCFMSHHDLIDCRESVRLLPSILKDGNAEEFHMEAARCRAQLEQLIQLELPSWQNIL